MAFLLIAPSLAVRCERIFSLMAVLVHPHQTCLASLVEAAQCLVLLANEGPDWPYTFVQMNDAILHVPLSSEGHLGILTEGKPQRNPCGLLHQLQVGGYYNVWSGWSDQEDWMWGSKLWYSTLRSCFPGTQLPWVKLPLYDRGGPMQHETQGYWHHPSLLPLNPSLILLKPLTSIFRGLWNSCSIPPLHPQCLSPSTAPPGGSHYLWPWVLHLPPE